MPTVIHQLADAFLERKRELAEKRKAKSVLPQSDYFMPKSSKEDMETQQRLLEEQGLPGVIKEGAKKMYENPVVNTAIGLVPGPSDIQAVGELGRSLYEGRPWYETAAWGASAIPGIPTFGGIIAGKGAKTADLAKLAIAEEMAKAGKSIDEIEAATKWAQTTDKGWKHEIPDYTAFTKGQGTVYDIAQKRGATVGNVLSHNPLYKAYPEVKDIPIVFQEGKGAAFGVDEAGNPLILLGKEEEGKSALLHEVQHYVQQKENFARGGGLEEFNPAMAEKTRDVLSWRRQVEQWIGKNWPNASIDTETLRNADQRVRDELYALGAHEFVPPAEVRDQALTYQFKQGQPLRQSAEKVVQEYGLNTRTTPYSEREMYKRLAGEEEARMVQKRMDLTPEELQVNPWWKTGQYGYETPPEGQVVRFNKIKE